MDDLLEAVMCNIFLLSPNTSSLGSERSSLSSLWQSQSSPLQPKKTLPGIPYHFIYVTRLQSFKKQLNEYSFDNSTTIFDINVSVNSRCAHVPPPPPPGLTPGHQRFFCLGWQIPRGEDEKRGQIPRSQSTLQQLVINRKVEQCHFKHFKVQFFVSVDVCFCISNSNNTSPRRIHAQWHQRVPNRIFRTRDFPYLKLGIWDFKSKSGRDSGLKVWEGSGMPKMTLEIMGLHEILGRDYISF